jgi:hypothetical protein
MPSNSSTAPRWADDTLYTGGSKVGEPVRVTAPTGEADQGIVAGESVKAGYLNAVLHDTIAWLADAGRGVFGDGSDGVVTLGAGTTTLTRDMYYDSLTVPNGSTLATNGNRVFVRDLLTFASGGIISADGGAGLAGNGSGRTGGPAAPGNSVGAGAAGGASTPGAAGTAGSSATVAAGGNGGAGGASNDTGSDASEAGGAGGTVTAPVFGWRHLPSVLGRLDDGNALRGGAGGGGGGGGDTGDGGSGGGGGGVCVVAAYRVVLTGAGCIRANGGVGGQGYTGPDALGNGGGGGGGGGVVILIRRGRSGSGTLVASGGAGGAGVGLGSNGSAGSAGTTLEIPA